MMNIKRNSKLSPKMKIKRNWSKPNRRHLKTSRLRQMPLMMPMLQSTSERRSKSSLSSRQMGRRDMIEKSQSNLLKICTKSWLKTLGTQTLRWESRSASWMMTKSMSRLRNTRRAWRSQKWEGRALRMLPRGLKKKTTLKKKLDRSHLLKKRREIVSTKITQFQPLN